MSQRTSHATSLAARIKAVGTAIALLHAYTTVNNVAALDEQTALQRPSLRRRMASTGRIPAILWFTHEHNILETHQPRAHYWNIMKTIDTYKYGWDGDMESANFVSDDFCKEQIAKVEPDLLPFFEGESTRSNKEDICRAAVLYVFGGFFIDVELELVEPFFPEKGTTFVTSRSCAGDCFDTAFVASAPEHPLLKKALSNMLTVYSLDLEAHEIGRYTMADAYNTLGEGPKARAFFLEEFRLDTGENPKFYPNVRRQSGSGSCNYVMHSPAAETVYFFQRFVGTSGCKPVEGLMRQGPKTGIPHNLIFTFDRNILETQQPKAHYDNVQNTIKAYNDALGDDAKTNVYFLDNDACTKTLSAVMPELVPLFLEEEIRSYKADICRLAALFLLGGYYIDVDMQVVQPYIAEDTETFVTTLGCAGGCFFQAFIAATPGHPIVAQSLQNMLKMYQNGGDSTMLGPISMSNAYQEVKDTVDGVHLLEELQLDVSPTPQFYPDLPRQPGSGNCNYVVHDPDKGVVHFFQRFLGYGGCQPLDGAQ